MSGPNGASRKQARIVILGGGFAGIYTAMYLEQLQKGRSDYEIALVNRENYMVFQPMLAEVVSGNVGILDTISPIRRLLKRTDLYVRDVLAVDLQAQIVTLGQGFRPRPVTLEYDHLVIAMGTVTDFRGMPGLPEHALPFKTLADAVQLRNHLIHVLEEAAIEPDAQLRRELLTFVVAGGGWSGTEVVAEINGFVRNVAKTYRRIDPDEIRVILLHTGERVLEREVSRELSVYATNILRKQGVDLRFNTRLIAASPDSAILKDGTRIRTKTLVSTVPASPNPLVETLDLPKERGRLKSDALLRVEGAPNIWAIGDCAVVPNPAGEGYCPPTAQHAVRMGKTVAENIVATLRGGEPKPYGFTSLGTMGSLGHQAAVAELFGRVKLSGFPAWLLWRTVYWSKIPGWDRRIKLGLSWFADLLLPPDLVQLKLGEARGVSQAHFEGGEIVFRQGDLGDCLYIILKGEVEIIREADETPKSGDEVQGQFLARLGPGEYFGEMALLNQRPRGATVRCASPVDVLCLRKGDFTQLVANLPELRQSFDHVVARRAAAAPDAVTPEEAVEMFHRNEG